MKVLYINSVFQFGSTGKIVYDLFQSQEDAYVIYGRKGAFGHQRKHTFNDRVFFVETPLEQKIDIVSSLLFDTHGLHSRKNTKKNIQLIQKIQPDLIHLHNLHGFYLNYPMLFAFLKEYQRPIVYTLHDSWAYTGYCSYYLYHQCDGFQHGCHHCPYRDTYPYRIFSHSKQNLTLKKMAYDGVNMTIVTPSKWLKDEVQKSILKQFDCRIIHNTIDEKQFYRVDGNDLRKQYHLGNKRIYLGVASVWTKQKGFDEYIRLSKQLEPNEQIVLVGVSEKQQKQLPSQILGIPRVGIEELRKWYSCADVFVNLTLEDNYPTVNLEARACKLPIVTYRSGGSPESAGLIWQQVIEPFDLDLLVKTIRQADLKVAKMDQQSMIQEYQNLYEEIYEKVK